MLSSIALINTTRCDLKCQHCLRGFPENRQDFPLDLLDKLLTEASVFGARQVGLTGGEAYLHPQFEQMVETIVRYGYTWHFTSNGQSTKVYLPLMKRTREQFTHLTVSIDGVNAETHDDIRNKKGAFEKVLASVRLYVKEGFRVQATMVLNQKNREQIEDFIALAENLGIKAVVFGGIIPTAWNQHLSLSDEEYLKLYQNIGNLRKKAKFKVSTTSSLYTRGGVNFCDVLNLREIAFNPQGEMIFCCDTTENGAVIGSLRKFPLKELIQRWLELSANLQAKRTEEIATGNLVEGFDTCSYCNHFLSSIGNVSDITGRSRCVA